MLMVLTRETILKVLGNTLPELDNHKAHKIADALYSERNVHDDCWSFDSWDEVGAD